MATFRAASAVATGSTSITITKPTGTVDGDIMLMVVTVHDITSKGSLPAGWTRFAETSSTNGTGFFAWKRASGEGASYVITGLTDSSAGCILSFYGCIASGDPIHASVGRANASGSFGTGGITTTVTRCMIVSAACVMDNLALSAWTCVTDPATLTEQADGGSTTGSDTEVGAAMAFKNVAGSTGASSYTHTSFENVGLLCAILSADIVTNTKTVKSSGGDYASLNAWEAGRQGDLPVLGYIEKAECYSFSDTTKTTIDGWTTSAECYIEIYTPTAERHDGKWNDAKYRLEPTLTAQYNYPLYNKENYARILGLQAKVTQAYADNNGIQSEPTDVGNVIIDSNIIQGVPAASELSVFVGIYCYQAAGLSEHRITNNLIYGFRKSSTSTNHCGIRIAGATSGTLNIDNNTIVGCRWGMKADATITTIAKNMLISDCNDAAYGTYAAGTDYNATNNASMGYTVTGGGNAHDRLNQTFTFIGAPDYHLNISDTGAKDHGVDLSGIFTNDIDGQTRSGTWDIGADETSGTLNYKSIDGSMPGTYPGSLSVQTLYARSSYGNMPGTYLGSIAKIISVQRVGNAPAAVGNPVKNISVSRVGNIPPATAGLAKSLIFFSTQSGNMPFSSAVLNTLRLVLKAVAGVMGSITGTIAKQIILTRTGALPSFSGSITRVINIVKSGTLPVFAATVTKFIFAKRIGTMSAATGICSPYKLGGVTVYIKMIGASIKKFITHRDLD